MTFSEYLRKKIEERGYTLRQVAAKCDGKPNHTYLSKLLSDPARRPSPSVLKRLAAGLNVPYEEMMVAAGYLPAPTSTNDRPSPSDPAWLSRVPPELRPEFDELLSRLSPEERDLYFRAPRELSAKGWQSVLDYMRWQLQVEEAERKRKGSKRKPEHEQA